MVNQIKLCCGTRKCPILQKDGDNILIVDDKGDVCLITIEQGLAFSDAVKKLMEQENAPKSIELTG